MSPCWSALADRVKGEVAVGIMFLGLALTFVLVYVLPGRARGAAVGVDPGRHPGGDRRVHDADLGRADQHLWAVALIVVGMWILFRSLRTQR